VKLSYSIYEAKAKLSEILRAVRRGRHITITDRGRDVARIVPIATGGIDERITDLQAAGILAPAAGGPVAGPDVGESRPGALQRFLRERD
jgi:prevent-host-death family protein